MGTWRELKVKARLTAIRMALRRPAPNRIPMKGPGMKGRNYFSVQLYSDRNRDMFFVQQIDGNRICGFFFDSGFSPGKKASIQTALLADATISIDHYIDERQFNYSSALEFIVHQFTFGARRNVWKDRFLQVLFNRKKLVRSDRQQVLQLIFDEALKSANFNYATSSAGLMDLLYSRRWANHPKNKQLRKYYRLLLESLVASGDLYEQSATDFSLAPQAFATIAQYEEDTRRHRDLVGLQKALIAVTVALVVVGAIQVGVIAYAELRGRPTVTTDHSTSTTHSP